MYLDNKYTTWYYNIINKAKARGHCPDTGKELHHIVPDSFFKETKRGKLKGWIDGNPNNPQNLVFVTIKEHLICHKLLTKMTTGRAKYIMLRALFLMLHSRKNACHIKYGHQYENLKETYRKMNTGHNHGNYKDEKFSFLNIATEEIKYCSQYDFYSHTGIDFRAVNRLVKRKIKTTNGWTLQGVDLTKKARKNKKPMVVKPPKVILSGSLHPMFDHTVYTWCNVHTNEIVKSTRLDLIKLYGLNNGNVGEVINGNRKTVSGWKLLN